MKSGRRVVASAVLAAATAASTIAGSLGGAQVAHAAGATFVVTTTSDSGAGSLRQAITDAELTADADTITFDPSVFTSGSLHTITLASALPTISKPLTIQGPGKDVLAISGNDASRIIVINQGNNTRPGVIVDINDLTLTHGYAAGTGYWDGGGALWVQKAQLTMRRVNLSHNAAGMNGGVAYLGSASMTVIDSVIEDNSAVRGGAIRTDYGDLGASNSFLSIQNSVMQRNSATDGGAIYGARRVEVIGSTITDNTASNKGGGLWLGYNFSHSITNSVITGNSAATGGGVVAGGAGWYKSMVTVTGSTISDNTATAGDGSGGIWIGSAILKLLNSTLDNGTAGDCKSIWEVSNTGAIWASNLISTAGSTVSDNSCNQFDRAALLSGWSAASSGGTSTLQAVSDPPFAVGDIVWFCGPNGCTTSSARSGVVTAVSTVTDTVDVTVTAGVSAAAYEAELYGAAWVELPKIGSISPASGGAAGGDVVTITGDGFGNPSASPKPTVDVAFDGVPATSITHVSDTEVRATSPAGAGRATVRVTGNANTAALESNELVDAFAYPGTAPVVTEVRPARGPSTGGTSVTIAGSNFDDVTAVSFGGIAARSFTVDSSTQITAVTAAGDAGLVDVTVTTDWGSDSLPAAFAFESSGPSGGTGQRTPAVASASQSAAPGAALEPPMAPTGVIATAGDGSALVQWSAPAWPGSRPVTGYRAVSQPAGGSCVTTETSCQITGLANGTDYTFTVTAESSVGWGDPSAASPAVTPKAAAVPRASITIAIAGKQKGQRGRPAALLTGSSTNLAAGTMLTPWVRVSPKRTLAPIAVRISVDASGRFRWIGLPRKALSVFVQTQDGSVRSNVVRMRSAAPPR